ncbi:MAG TPA: ferredoxin [Pseudomonadales bacterium]
MRAICDLKLCQGHGRCEAMAPEIYKLDDNGYLALEVIEIPPGLEEQARLGADSCPEQVIRIEE